MAERASPEPHVVPNTPTNDYVASPKKPTNGPLLQAIKKFVDLTNSALSSVEEATDESSTMIVSRLGQLGKQGRYIATRTMATYERRDQYGQQVVAGSAVLVGAAVALRRGKFPAAVAAGLTGTAAYGVVYGYENNLVTSWRDRAPKNE